MTQAQLIQEYDYDPTLTTSELSALEAEREAKEAKEAEERAIAEEYEDEMCEVYHAHIDRSEAFASVKSRCHALIDRMPFDVISKARTHQIVDSCANANELFWGFLFEFHSAEIEADLNARFPDIRDALKALEADNAKLYRKL